MQTRRRFTQVLVVCAVLSLTIAAQKPGAQVPTPSQFLGFEVGADRKLADYRQIVSYFKALAAAAPDRVELETLGKTTLGEDMIMAVISSPENLHNKARYKEIAAKLAMVIAGWFAISRKDELPCGLRLRVDLHVAQEAADDGFGGRTKRARSHRSDSGTRRTRIRTCRPSTSRSRLKSPRSPPTSHR